MGSDSLPSFPIKFTWAQFKAKVFAPFYRPWFFETIWHQYKNPDLYPDHSKPPIFDPLVGFPNGRKVRECNVTFEELNAWRVPYDLRDYCADKWIAYMKCTRESSWPHMHCENEEHIYDECIYQDGVLRLKEYEREKRLLARERRILEKMRKEQLKD